MSKARLKAGGWQIGTDTVDATAAEIDAAAGTGISQAELAVLNAVTPGTAAASKAVVLDSNLDVASLRHLTLSGNLVTSANVGTAGTGSTAAEQGDSRHHVTTLVVGGTLPAIAGGAALAVGLALYTFPAGVILIHGSYMNLGITQSEGNINTDTPDGGLGTLIGSGANATLNLVGAGAENVMTGQTFNNCTGTAEVLTVGTQLVIQAADSHILYFNTAATWTAGGDSAAALAGTVVVDWSFLA